MVTIIMGIIMLVILAALVVEIGIASWNIRRANRYRTKSNIAENQAESMRGQVEHIKEKYRNLDKYSTDISWLLKFLYNRHDKFDDLDRDIEEYNKDREALSNEEVKKLDDLKRAQKLVKVTVRASDRLNGFMTTIATQVNSILEELKMLEDEEKENSDTPAEVATKSPAEEEKEGIEV